jgi:acetyl esterase/lipase
MGSAPPATTWLSLRLEFAPRDDEWDAFYEANKDHVPSLEGPVADVRQIMYNTKMRGQGKAAPIAEGLVVEDHDVHTQHADIKLRTYLPEGSSEGHRLPAMLYFHGGGFALGDLDGEDRTCRSLCVDRKIVVVGVDYRLAPEHPYPAALDDSWDSLDWVSTTLGYT